MNQSSGTPSGKLVGQDSSGITGRDARCVTQTAIAGSNGDAVERGGAKSGLIAGSQIRQRVQCDTDRGSQNGGKPARGWESTSTYLPTYLPTSRYLRLRSHLEGP